MGCAQRLAFVGPPTATVDELLNALRVVAEGEWAAVLQHLPYHGQLQGLTVVVSLLERLIIDSPVSESEPRERQADIVIEASPTHSFDAEELAPDLMFTITEKCEAVAKPTRSRGFIKSFRVGPKWLFVPYVQSPEGDVGLPREVFGINIEAETQITLSKLVNLRRAAVAARGAVNVGSPLAGVDSTLNPAYAGGAKAGGGNVPPSGVGGDKAS